MELGCEPEKKKTAQESEDERWARMDKRIERARAKDELGRPVMGTIFLVYVSMYVCMSVCLQKYVCQNAWAELHGPCSKSVLGG